MISHDEQTIIALCTPQGNGALALLRLSGDNALEIAAKLAQLPSGKKITDVTSHTVHFGYVIDQHDVRIDHVMFTVMHAPKTFTGQNTVEITCHNSPFLIEAIIEQALVHGARIAQEGEFTKRAYLNKKIDLIQAESINELIHASTKHALKQSLSQLEGSFSHWIQAFEQELTKNIAFSEASFEFIDEEMEFGDLIRTSLQELMQKIKTIKKTFDQQNHIRQGVRIALIGAVNAGKSSLFNALVGKNRAIVSSLAGTTRDVIEAGVYKKASYWTLVDTAGLRQTANIIEQEGIKRSFEEAQTADCILLVFDGSRTITTEELQVYQELYDAYQQKIIVVQTKLDMVSESYQLFENIKPFQITVHDLMLVKALETAIEQKINQLVFNELDSPFLLNKRHFNLLLSLEKNIDQVLIMLKEPIAYELVSLHLKDALEKVSELSGKTISEQSMDAIFREFCVGK